jgi:hypothetical protein
MAFIIFKTFQAKYTTPLFSKIIQIAIFAVPKKILYDQSSKNYLYSN